MKYYRVIAHRQYIKDDCRYLHIDKEGQNLDHPNADIIIINNGYNAYWQDQKWTMLESIVQGHIILFPSKQPK
jgi:hypothetical protein